MGCNTTILRNKAPDSFCKDPVIAGICFRDHYDLICNINRSGIVTLRFLILQYDNCSGHDLRGDKIRSRLYHLDIFQLLLITDHIWQNHIGSICICLSVLCDHLFPYPSDLRFWFMIHCNYIIYCEICHIFF